MQTYKPTVVFYDENVQARENFFRDFQYLYTVIIVDNKSTCLSALETHHVDTVICAFELQKASSIDILSIIKEKHPEVTRLLAVNYANVNATANSLDQGLIYNYLLKPWSMDEVNEALKAAVEYARHTRAETLSDFVSISSFTQHEKILLIDSCTTTYQSLVSQFAKNYEIVWARNIDSVVDTLKQHEFGLIISEMYLNDVNIVSLLKSLREKTPLTIIMIMSHFKENESLDVLVHSDTIYRCLPKPVRASFLDSSVQRAMLQHRQLKSEVQLHKMSANEKMSVNDDKTSQRVKDFLHLEQTNNLLAS